MRRTLVIGLSALFSLLTLGCGNDGLLVERDLGGGELSNNQDGSVSDDASNMQDSSVAFDLSEADFAGIQCGNMTCEIGSTCCLVPDVQNQTTEAMCISGSQCANRGIPATCDGPEDCPQDGGICCIDLMLGPQNQLSGNASCASNCTGSIAIGSNGDTLRSKLCRAPSDCAGFRGSTPIGNEDFDSCCGYPGITYQFCAPEALTGAIGDLTCATPEN